jgi:hypothetical protein
MAEAIKKGTTLDGWMEARSKLLELIDAETVLVGHALVNDLDILRVVHTRVVDSAILTRNALGRFKGIQFPLQSLAKSLQEITTQNNKRERHIVLWNVMTARELVIWSVKNPAALRAWARAVWEEERRKKEVTKEKAGLKKAVKLASLKSKGAEKKALAKAATEQLRRSKRVRVPNLENLSIKSEDQQQDKASRKSKRMRGEDPDNISRGQHKNVLDEKGLREYKRLKPTPMASETEEAEHQGLLGEVSFKNLTLRPASIQKSPPQPSSTPDAMEDAF